MKWIFIAMLALCGCGQDNSAPGLTQADIQAANILIVGDSISEGYYTYVHEAMPNVEHSGYCPYLKDKTTDYDNTGNSRRLAACITLDLSRGIYDTVLFNAGLHDVHIAGCTNGGTAHQIELSDYLMNLQATVDAIRAYGATPVFVTTTPVQGMICCHYEADIIAYNSAAVQMMNSQGVQVIDLFTFMLPHQKFHLSNNIHYTPDGYDLAASYIIPSV